MSRRGVLFGAAVLLLLAGTAPAEEDRDALWARAHRLYQLDELDEAEALFRRAGALGPHWYNALMLGAIAERRFEFDRALEEYRRALDLDPARESTRQEVARVEAIVRDLQRFREADRRLQRDLTVVLGVAIVGAVLALGLALRP